MKALIVKSDGLIYAAEVPEEPPVSISIYQDMARVNRYERELASATESAVLVSDQEKARKILVKEYGDGNLLQRFEGVYPIPGLQWTVMNWSKNVGTDDSGAPIIKLWQVAILKESTPSNEQESQEELWKEIYIDFKDGEGWINFAKRMNERFTITRKP